MCALAIFFLIFKKLKIPFPRDGQVAFNLVCPAYTVNASLKVIHNPTSLFKLSTTYFAYLVKYPGAFEFNQPPLSANHTGFVKCQSVTIGSIPLSRKALTKH